jgi:hypothetical protein
MNKLQAAIFRKLPSSTLVLSLEQLQKMLEIRLIDSREDNRFKERRKLIKNGITSQHAYPHSHDIHSLVWFLSSLLITAKHYNLIVQRDLMGLCYTKVDETATHNRSYY